MFDLGHFIQQEQLGVFVDTTERHAHMLAVCNTQHPFRTIIPFGDDSESRSRKSTLVLCPPPPPHSGSLFFPVLVLAPSLPPKTPLLGSTIQVVLDVVLHVPSVSLSLSRSEHKL